MQGTNLDAIYKSNSEKEKEGKWMPIADGVEFLVKRYGGANNSKVKEMNAKFVKPFARQLQKGILPQEVERNIYVKTFVHVSMVDWKGVLDGDGNEIPFSIEAAIDLFTQLPELFDDVATIASDFETFKEDLGKS